MLREEAAARKQASGGASRDEVADDAPRDFSQPWLQPCTPAANRRMTRNGKEPAVFAW